MIGKDGAAASLARPLALAACLVAALLVIGSAVRDAAGQDGARELIGDVRVVGNRTITTEQVLRFLNLRPGQEYSQRILIDAMDRLTKARLFRTIRPREDRSTDGRVVLTFEVQEFPNLITDIVFQNWVTVKPDELEKMVSLRRGVPLDPATNRRACYEIQEHLKSKGRYFANVSLVEGDRPSDNRVVFNITEGPVVRVRSATFVGNTFAVGERLRTQIDTSRALLTLAGGTFQPVVVDNDVLKIEDYYKANGFLDCRGSRELHFSDDGRLVDVIFHIDEGRRYQIKDVRVVAGKDKEELSSIVQAKSGEWYSERTVRGDVVNLQDYEGWRGRQTLAEKRLYTVPDEPGVVRMQYEVRETAPAKVGRVIIVGNEWTKDRVIRRALGFFPGQTLRYPEIRVAERDLMRLNIFDNGPDSKPTITVLETDSEYKDILVQVKEAPTGSLMFGAGINSDAGLVGSIVLNERNFDIFRFPRSLDEVWEGKAFRGAGQELRIEAIPGTELQRYTISFREPFLFDLPIALTSSAYYYDRIFNEDKESRLGGRFGLSKQLTKEIAINGSVRIEDVNISNVSVFAPPEYTSVVGSHLLIAPRIGVTYDTRDSFLRPTEGGLVDFSYEHVFGDFTFPLVNLEASRYFTTFQRADGSGKQVVALRSQISYAGNDAPVFERFYAGGFRSMRGFEFRGMNPFVNGYAVGGRFQFLNSAEYQVPILANDMLYAVAFVDTGTVEQNVEINTYRVTAGFGLRLTVPMLGPVPIALDFGFPLVKAPTDRDQIFSFWVGMFR